MARACNHATALLAATVIAGQQVSAAGTASCSIAVDKLGSEGILH